MPKFAQEWHRVPNMDSKTRNPGQWAFPKPWVTLMQGTDVPNPTHFCLQLKLTQTFWHGFVQRYYWEEFRCRNPLEKGTHCAIVVCLDPASTACFYSRSWIQWRCSRQKWWRLVKRTGWPPRASCTAATAIAQRSQSSTEGDLRQECHLSFETLMNHMRV